MTKYMISPSFGAGKTVLACVFMVCVAALSITPAAADEAFGEGYVDPKPFLDLAGEDDLTVEISIKGALLRLLAATLSGSNDEVSDMVADLTAIQAVIVDLTKPEKREKGLDLLRNTLRKLEKDHWERLAVVKEDDVNLSVLIRVAGDTVDGLVVLLHEKTDGQLIFVNISGMIDLAKLEALGEQLKIPGLDQVPESR